VQPIILDRPFLWPNHLEALQKGFLLPGTSSVISFPTGAGKTTLSELKATSVLAMGGAVIYLAPTHALVSQMKADLAKSFPSIPVRDSLLVDDFYAEIGESFSTFDPQIVVMTPERCLALLSEDSTDFGGVRLVIFDECHLLHPKAGGQNRRSLDAMLTLLHLRQASPNADWLLLSAMMANADELAGWVRDLTSRPCLSLNLDWKPTRQARGCLVYDREELDAIKTRLRQAANKARTPGKALGNPGVAIERELLARPFGFFSLLQTWQTRHVADYVLLPLIGQRVPLTAARSRFGTPTWYPTPNKNEVASQLAADCVRAGLKVLLFVQNTRDASKIAKLIGTAAHCTDKLPTLSPDEQHLLRVAIEEMGSSDSVLTPVGCAGCHHANMLPVERELVESLFRNSDGLQALAATATLAQGMNLPADMVLIVGDERFDTELEGFAPLDAHELLNAAGRAGRAGLVAQGLVVVIPHSFVEFDPQTNSIGSRWTQLQESVFSRADQCLLIQDPIDYYIDRVQDAASLEDPEARYFLRRIPRGSFNARRLESFAAARSGCFRNKDADCTSASFEC
jgi:replicative superfamily II helicase